MKYIEMRKHQNNDSKRCQDFEDMGKIRCLCQNGSRHNNQGVGTEKLRFFPYKIFFNTAVLPRNFDPNILGQRSFFTFDL